MLIIERERKEVDFRKSYEGKKNQNLIIFKILSLARLQKMLKIRRFTVRKQVLERKPRGWLDNL